MAKAASAYSVEALAALPEFAGGGGGIADGSIGSAKLGGDITTAGKSMLTAANAQAQAALMAPFISGAGGFVNGQKLAFVRNTPGEAINAKLEAADALVGQSGIIVIVDSEGVIENPGVSLTCNRIVPLCGRPLIYGAVDNGGVNLALPGARDYCTVGPFFFRKPTTTSGKQNSIAVQLGDRAYRWVKRSTAYKAGDILAYDQATDLAVRALNNGSTAASAPTLTASAGTQTDGSLQVEYVANLLSGAQNYKVDGRVVMSTVDLDIVGFEWGLFVMGWENKLRLNIRECTSAGIFAVMNGCEVTLSTRNNGGWWVDCQALHITSWTHQDSTGGSTHVFDGCFGTAIDGFYCEVTGGTPVPAILIGETIFCRGTKIGPCFWGPSFTPANPPISLNRSKGFRGSGPGDPFAGAGNFAAPLQTGNSSQYAWDQYGSD